MQNSKNIKPLILVANDDGITSKGIAFLVKLASQLGEVVVVAPDSAQSGMGHAITLETPIRSHKSNQFGTEIEAYSISGTPADCVKFGRHYILKDRQIDLIVSGVNHGSNSSISVVYSGTMSAALEGAIEGVPSIGFSLCEYGPHIDFSHCETWMVKIIKKVLIEGMPTGVAFNVNFPAKDKGEIKGIKIGRQANANYKEFFIPRTDPYGKSYFWMDGQLVNSDKDGGTDEDHLAAGYVSIVPCKYDLTDYEVAKQLIEWQF